MIEQAQRLISAFQFGAGCRIQHSTSQFETPDHDRHLAPEEKV
jgi:hypothetical protein